ncbi:MAG: hypothetical protein ABIR11_14185 [Candidatus Limnocylindrales bacterium]
MRPARLAIAFLFALIGVVWVAQGLNLLPGTYMSGSLFWAIVGALLIAGAVALVVRERRRVV